MRQEDSKPAIISANGCGCLVLLMCIGVIGAIAVPSYLNRTSRAKQSEAKQYVSSMNKGQQAYFVENNKWATSIPDLGLGMKTETTNCKYSIRVTKQAAFNRPLAKKIYVSIKGFEF